ncbi:MAG: hypothetical protein Ct9H90mP11_00100 [Acidimicrobiales bacterium]|nr:MAG: hypothetical protein Ct9H90mP11_00100 [Acidimicrobiales bacterium]
MTEVMEQLADQEGLDLSGNEGDRFKARAKIHPHIQAWCQRNSFNEIKRIWNDLGVCWGPYQTFKELVENDQRVSEANPMFTKLIKLASGNISRRAVLLISKESADRYLRGPPA